MGITHLVARQAPLAVLGDERPAGEPMVDDPRSGRIALSSAEGVDPEAHGSERTDCADEEWSGLWPAGRTARRREQFRADGPVTIQEDTTE